MSLLLDTDVCIAFLRGKEPEILRRMEAGDENRLKLCSVVKAELLFGARKSRWVDEGLEALKALFRKFESVPFDDAAAEQYGVVRTGLSKAGSPIGENDLFISCIALSRDYAVVTRNRKEFSRVPGLRVESW